MFAVPTVVLYIECRKLPEMLTEQECATLIQVVGLQNQLMEFEIQSVYFRGCYDSVNYLKKAGIL